MGQLMVNFKLSAQTQLVSSCGVWVGQTSRQCPR
jgi:hypothetical protein